MQSSIINNRLSTVQSPSSRGLGHCPFKAATRVRIPLGTPRFSFPHPFLTILVTRTRGYETMFAMALAYFLFLFSTLFLSSCEKKKDPQIRTFGPEDTSFYKVYIDGDVPSYLIKEIQDHSLLYQLVDRPPLSPKALEHRIEQDFNNIILVCHEYGYFEAQVSYKIETSKKKLKVRLELNLGPAYTVGKVNIKTIPDHTIALDPTIHLILKSGEPVTLEKIKMVSLLIEQYFQNKGFPFAKSDLPTATIDKINKRLDLDFIVQIDQKINFDLLNIKNNKGHLKKSYIRNRLIWKRGDVYQTSITKRTQKKLMETGLFSSVAIKQEKKNGTLETTVDVVEAPPRLYGGSIKYNTSESIAGKLFWTHYNFAGGGEKLGTSLEHGIRNSEAKVYYDIPDILLPEMHVRQELSYQREKNKAYKSHIAKGELSLLHKINEEFRHIFAVNYERGQVSRHRLRTKNSIVGLSITPDYNSSDSHVDPTEGLKLTAFAAPHTDTSNKNRFTILKAALMFYLPLWSKDQEPLLQKGEGIPEGKGILATWIRSGYIVANHFSRIPIYKRFYSGGPSSIRGYGLKMLGPIDADKAPTGGRTLLETGTELRYNVINSFGGAVFCEAGTVTPDHSIKLKKGHILWSYGLGLRYFTKMGPIRFDIGFPNKIRKGLDGKKIDAPFQIYLNFGQAF